METQSNQRLANNGSRIVNEGAANPGAAMEMREMEISMNKNLHLVPCRWAHSGWKYVQADPSDTRFFQNPNRVNNFGVNGDKKRFAASSTDGFN